MYFAHKGRLKSGFSAGKISAAAPLFLSAPQKIRSLGKDEACPGARPGAEG